MTINGHRFRTAVGVMSGRSLIPVSADVRRQAGIQAGDNVTVEVRRDTEPRTVDVPARAAFDALSPSAKRRHVLAVDGAKSPQPRQRRIEYVVSELSSPRTR